MVLFLYSLIICCLNCIQTFNIVKPQYLHLYIFIHHYAIHSTHGTKHARTSYISCYQHATILDLPI